MINGLVSMAKLSMEVRSEADCPLTPADREEEELDSNLWRKEEVSVAKALKWEEASYLGNWKTK